MLENCGGGSDNRGDTPAMATSILEYSATHHQRDFGLELRLQHVTGQDLLVVAAGHVGEQHSVIRAANPKLLLHDLRGQSDLASNQAPAGRQRMRGVFCLNLVSADLVG
jgi:hypothetical protein